MPSSRSLDLLILHDWNFVPFDELLLIFFNAIDLLTTIILSGSMSLDSKYKRDYVVFFFFVSDLFSLKMMFSKFKYIATNGSISFFVKTD